MTTGKTRLFHRLGQYQAGRYLHPLTFEGNRIERVVEDWGKYLGDNTMSTTILDRLMHRSALLAFEGKSYRLKEAVSRIASASAV